MLLLASGENKCMSCLLFRVVLQAAALLAAVRAQISKGQLIKEWSLQGSKCGHRLSEFNHKPAVWRKPTFPGSNSCGQASMLICQLVIPFAAFAAIFYLVIKKLVAEDLPQRLAGQLVRHLKLTTQPRNFHLRAAYMQYGKL